jgi:predicted acylesterase/phospholipase RssA
MNIFKKPIGLFLCGGGAFGSFQSGVLKKLCDAALEFDVLAGFSIGSLNGAAYCFDKVKELKDIWSRVDNNNIFKFSPSYHHMPIELYKIYYNGSLLSSLRYKLENKISRMTLFSNKPVYGILQNWLGKGEQIFLKKTRFHVISHCIEKKLPYISTYEGRTLSSNMNFIDALVASSSIPLIFPPVKIKEKDEIIHLVDGGTIGIATINLNIFDGCKTVIIISNSSEEDLNYSKKGFLGYFETKVRRMLAIHVRKIYESRVFIKSGPDVHFIYPEKLLEGGIIDFKAENCLKNFEYGEKLGDKFLKSYKKI